MIHCFFCSREELLSLAIREGWHPAFFCEVHNTEIANPVCPECQSRWLTLDEQTGELVRLDQRKGKAAGV